jgi:hypothetical protein
MMKTSPGRIAIAIAIAALGAGAAAPVAAQQTVATYFAALGPQDHFNSSGQRLTTFAQVLQQDRANYHRFGRADVHDQGDPVFGSVDMRAMIPAQFAAGDNGWWNRPVSPPSGPPLDAEILVFVCATGGRLTHLIVNHANGDGYITCEGVEQAGQ